MKRRILFQFHIYTHESLTHGCILQIYNCHGRIGIYAPAERAAILIRFHGKRPRRNWQKKIRYNCRKNLADSRLRVKGRFVKRSEQDQLASLRRQMHILRRRSEHDDDDIDEEELASSPPDDDIMPDVNDPEAGFCPTEDQPYRRFRRHTVT